MNLKPALLIKSTALLADTYFADAVILLAEFNEKGALGFVINRSFERTLNQLEEFKDILPFPIYEGGPVDQEHLYFLHQRPDLIEEGVAVDNGIYYMGGNFKQAVEAINNRTITTADLKLFVGYCGWNTGELEAEIKEGSWIVEEGMPEEVFMNW
ncbi:YqgE/AlgH family protein [Lacibacter sp. MH-610]|uniref:YqgE/AlgH family protein n=1 Tax=Lacibacter sp. MH-610 TaxID=3020883 RepID=UPI0038913126